jgi:hypothetical protein
VNNPDNSGEADESHERRHPRVRIAEARPCKPSLFACFEFLAAGVQRHYCGNQASGLSYSASPRPHAHCGSWKGPRWRGLSVPITSRPGGAVRWTTASRGSRPIARGSCERQLVEIPANRCRKAWKALEMRRARPRPWRAGAIEGPSRPPAVVAAGRAEGAWHRKSQVYQDGEVAEWLKAAVC